jgi:hypothetical protein
VDKFETTILFGEKIVELRKGETFDYSFFRKLQYV